MAEICGIDEVGRGPLAGPVCAVCVVLSAEFPIEILADSKKLKEPQREKILPVIFQQAFWGLGWASVAEIDKMNILQATFLAMRRAMYQLNRPIQLALVDGNQDPGLFVPTQTIIKGDDKEPCIMAASIVAKCLRDRYMHKLDMQYPLYGFARHKGYGTQYHRQAIKTYGATIHHRQTFLNNMN